MCGSTMSVLTPKFLYKYRIYLSSSVTQYTLLYSNQTESFQFTQSMTFLGIISEMQQKTNIINMLVITINNVAEYTLEFLENN